jgi:prenyltransferase beta subunit/uncharacterized membrane protein
VSWPLAAFAVVFVVLVVAWLAYERSRPSARMVAVVGTLAAIAALGRDAFVALPDVKPITAMTLVVGYALGPLPGFTVGAVGMLASNIVLGQGPYTPWQMAAWGLVGLLGAVLKRLAGDRLSRTWIALACTCSALIAKEIMNVYEWTVSASHTLPALALTVSKGVPFDVTDAVASFLFGFAFGPELARLLARTRERMTVVWEPSVPAAILLSLTVLGLVGFVRPRSAFAQSPTARAGQISARVVAFLERAQNADGGFGAAPGERSSELYSAWAALGLAAAERDPLHVRRSGRSALDAIRDEASTLQSAGDLERTILALHACGAAASLPGLGDLVQRLERYRESDGSFEHLVNITAFAVLALRADSRPAGDPTVRGAAGWLEGQQRTGGGFGYAGRGAAADVDDTSAAIQALAAAGRAGGAVASSAVGFLTRSVNRDGGFPQQPGGEPNAQSTAWAVQALVAARRDPTRPLPGARQSPLLYLQGLVAPDGSVRYSNAGMQTPVWVSAQVLTALAEKPLPIGRPSPAEGSASADGAGAGATSVQRLAREAKATPAQVDRAGSAVSQRPSLGAGARSRLGADARVALDEAARAGGILIGLALYPLERQA